MPIINDVTAALAFWLELQQFTPPVRETVLCDILPAGAYPQLAVLVLAEEFHGPSETVARLALRVSCAAGRADAAQSQARDLAHQLRRALHRCHTFDGAVKRLVVRGISYDGQRGQTEPVVASATVHAELAYCETPV